MSLASHAHKDKGWMIPESWMVNTSRMFHLWVPHNNIFSALIIATKLSTKTHFNRVFFFCSEDIEDIFQFSLDLFVMQLLTKFAHFLESLKALNQKDNNPGVFFFFNLKSVSQRY